jgi:Ran GTPase-activating protein (RanGAP) involved in mRNA processing and transport
MKVEGNNLTEEEESKLISLCALCGSDVYSINLTHQKAHFDVFEMLFAKLPHLEEFSLTYCVLNAAVAFKLDMIGFKQADAIGIQRVLKTYPSIKSLSLPGNRIDAELLKAMLAGLVKNNTLTYLDISHNKIDDEGAAAIATVLQKKDLGLRHIDLSDNLIRSQGAKLLGFALGKNTQIQFVSLRLNRLGDEGGARFFENLQGNRSVRSLNLSNNQMGVESAKIIADFLQSSSALNSLFLSGNEFKEEGGRTLSEGVLSCTNLREVDVRSCGLDPQDMQSIDRATQKRVQSLKLSHFEHLEQEMREDVQKMVNEKVRKSHGI